MSSTFASSPWPAPAQSQSQSPTVWRLARELLKQRDGKDRAAVQWRMARNSSFVPGCLLTIFIALAVLSLGIGAAFWWLGAPAVLPLAGAELLVLGAAFWICSRHAGDAETITLADRELNVEQRFGCGIENVAFRAEWVRVEPVHGDGSLVEITGQGHRVRVGRYLRPELRMALARELRQAVRLECARPAAQETFLGQQR
jgi:uncharacterized membrane protein